MLFNAVPPFTLMIIIKKWWFQAYFAGQAYMLFKRITKSQY